MTSRIITLAGPPKAGKSLIAGELYKLLREKRESFFIERLSPDSEGQWTYESGRQDLARSLKNSLKEKGEFFSPAFVEFKCRAIRGLAKAFRLVILDLGGMPSPENRQFIKAACEAGQVLAVVLGRPSPARQAWEEFFSQAGVSCRVIETPAWDSSNLCRAAEIAAEIAAMM